MAYPSYGLKTNLRHVYLINCNASTSTEYWTNINIFLFKHNFTTAETESFQSPEQIVKENQILKLNEKKENEDKRRQSVVEIEQNKSLPPVVEVKYLFIN